MSRRDLVAASVAASVGGLAGCTASPDPKVNERVYVEETVAVSLYQRTSTWTITRVGAESFDMDVEVVYPNNTATAVEKRIPYDRLTETDIESVEFIGLEPDPGESLRIIADTELRRKDVRALR